MGNLESKNIIIAIHGGPGMTSDYMLNLERLTDLPNAILKTVVFDQCGHFWHESSDHFFSNVRAFLGLPEEI